MVALQPPWKSGLISQRHTDWGRHFCPEMWRPRRKRLAKNLILNWWEFSLCMCYNLLSVRESFGLGLGEKNVIMWIISCMFYVWKIWAFKSCMKVKNGWISVDWSSRLRQNISWENDWFFWTLFHLCCLSLILENLGSNVGKWNWDFYRYICGL